MNDMASVLKDHQCEYTMVSVSEPHSVCYCGAITPIDLSDSASRATAYVETQRVSAHTAHQAAMLAAAGYRGPARIITTADELDALPIEACVLSDMGNVYVKDCAIDNPEETFWAVGGSECKANRILLPAAVLHIPGGAA